MNKIILASNNKNKIKEIKEMLPNMEVLSLNDIGFLDDIVEDGLTFSENALIKARATKVFINSKNIKAWILSDDSGLCVKALNNEPGIYSARYAGNHNDQANRDKLLNELKNKSNRDAFFMCSMALISPNGEEHIFNGKVEGKILDKETGSNGFGYDCLFYSTDLNKCLGLCSQQEKASVSHRGRALKQVVEFLSNI